MLTRLDRYLLREVTVTSVAVTGVLLVILAVQPAGARAGAGGPGRLPGQRGADADRAHHAAAAHGAGADRAVPGHRAGARSPVPRERDDGDGGLRRRTARHLPADPAVHGRWSWCCSRGCRSGSCRRPGVRAQELRIEAMRAAQFGALEAGRFRTFAGRRRGVLRREGRALGPARGRVRAAARQGPARDRGGRARRAARRRPGRAVVRAVRRAPLRGRARQPRVARRRVRRARHPGAHARVQGAQGAARAASPTRDLLGSDDPGDRSETRLAHRRCR